MKNLKVSIKLIIGFLVITAFSLIIACIGIFSTNSINGNYEYLIDSPLKRQLNLRQMQADFTMMRYRAANFVMNSGDTEFINETLLPQYQSAYKSFQDNYAAFIQNNNSDTRWDPAKIEDNNNKAEKLGELIKQ